MINNLLKLAVLFVVMLGAAVLCGGVYVGHFQIAQWPDKVREAVILVPLMITFMVFGTMVF